MKNIDLIYENVNESSISNIKRKKRIHIFIKNPQIDSNALYFIASKFKFLLKFRFLERKIFLHFDNFIFADKITFLILDALIYNLLSCSTKFKLYILVHSNNYDSTIHEIGFISTALYRTKEKTKSSYIDKKIFIDEYEKFSCGKNFYRKLLTRKDLDKSITPSKIFTDVATILQCVSDDSDWIDMVSEATSELICNASSHTTGDCLLDINFSNTIGNKTNRDKKYFLINISVINLSENNLFDKIKSNIQSGKYNNYDKLYNKIYHAYNNHKNFFSENYNEDHFFMITAFQNRVSTRSLDSGIGGTGLTKLIQSLVGQAEDDFSYVLSGKNILVFKNDYLNMSKDKFIGFNKENDYFNHIPDKEVTCESSLYLPGTAYNLLLIK